MYISTLEMCKGCWQVPLTPESKEIKAFKTPFGHFRFTVLPFGLNSAHVTFQQLMGRVLTDMESYVAAYPDHVVVFSNSWEEHLCHL